MRALMGAFAASLLLWAFALGVLATGYGMGWWSP